MANVWHNYDYVVGVDPGFGCTGLSVLGPDGVVCARWYKSNSDDSVEQRSLWLTRMVVCKVFAVTGGVGRSALFAVEDNHFSGGKSAQTALMQRELIGSIATMACSFGYGVVRVSPTSAKKAITGSGRAEKDDVREAAKQIDGYPIGLPKYADEAVADATAVAMAAIAMEGGWR